MIICTAQVVQRLVAEGGDLYQKDMAGNTPTDLAPSRQLLVWMHNSLKPYSSLEGPNEQVSHDARNLREPSRRLVDYVAILAFDPKVKQSTVDWRCPSADHPDFAFDPNASVFAAAPTSHIERLSQQTDGSKPQYLVHTSVINRQVPALYCVQHLVALPTSLA